MVEYKNRSVGVRENCRSINLGAGHSWGLASQEFNEQKTTSDTIAVPGHSEQASEKPAATKLYVIIALLAITNLVTGLLFVFMLRRSRTISVKPVSSQPSQNIDAAHWQNIKTAARDNNARAFYNSLVLWADLNFGRNGLDTLIERSDNEALAAALNRLRSCLFTGTEEAKPDLVQTLKLIKTAAKKVQDKKDKSANADLVFYP